MLKKHGKAPIGALQRTYSSVLPENRENLIRDWNKVSFRDSSMKM